MKENSLAQLQIRSYNQFCEELVKVIEEEGRMRVPFKPQFYPGSDNSHMQEWEFEFSNVTASPAMHQENDSTRIRTTPMMCRMRDLTYQKEIWAQVDARKYEISRGQNRSLIDSIRMPKVTIAYVPLMVKSKWCQVDQIERGKGEECPYDQGGYFIIRGSEKFVIAQERLAFNTVYTFQTKMEREPWTA